MTGLDPEQDVIIEIATIVTDAHLNVLAEGPSIVIGVKMGCHDYDKFAIGSTRPNSPDFRFMWNTLYHNCH